MSRFRMIYDANGLVATIENGETTFLREGYGERKTSELPSPMVIRDIEPYKNMINGKMISSRSEHKELLRRHNCIEVGNEKMETKIAPPANNRRESLHRQLGDMSDKQANKILKQIKGK